MRGDERGWRGGGGVERKDKRRERVRWRERGCI